MTLEGAFRARGQLLPLCATMMISVVIFAGSASAIPLTPFRYEAQAQRHCLADVVVKYDERRRRFADRACSEGALRTLSAALDLYQSRRVDLRQPPVVLSSASRTA